MTAITSAALLAAASSALTVTEWDLPESTAGWLMLLVGTATLIAYVVSLGRRDTQSFPWYVTAFLTVLRLGVVAALAVILLNPQERTQTIVNRPSRLAVLIDTSLSMRDPEQTPTSSTSADASRRSRHAAVASLFDESPLIDDLTKIHEVNVYTFDTDLKPQRVFRQAGDSPLEADGAADSSKPPAAFNWSKSLEPTGVETRLGESLAELIRTTRGSTLAGIVVVSDGGLNAGAGEEAALALARDARRPVKIATVGVGGLERPANLVVAEVRAPSEVRYNRELEKQDPFEIVAFVRGDELSGRQAEVELLRYPANANPDSAAVLGSTQVTLPEDGRPIEVRFPQEPDSAGEFRFVVRARPVDRVVEYRNDDNQRDTAVTFSERNTAVLIVAGGPMRDYHFVRNLLHRSATVDVDVWLQTVSAQDLPSVSQDSDDLIAQFPPTFPQRPIVERLPEGSRAPKTYDVVIAFDVDWSAIPEEGRAALSKWVELQRGGLILVAGDVYTPLAADASGDMAGILDLYPVILSNRFLLEMIDSESSQAWPFELTESGKAAGFLQLADDADQSAAIWQRFEGVYRAFPTRRAKDLAEVYATFPDPTAAGEGPPVLLASQQYGGGRVLYLGSPETWRLRSIDENVFNTFWVKAVREVGQGRLRQGDGPGIFLLDRESYLLGESVRVRVQMNSPLGDPLISDEIKLFVTDPEGRTLVPAGQEMKADPAQPGQYSANFRTPLPGRYQVKVVPPGGEQPLSTTIEVTLPQLEQMNPQQNRALLVKLADETGGAYFSIDQAAKGLSELFKTSAAESVPIDERLRTLWDRAWLLYLMAGLLSVEWLTRKLLKLA
ncbi:MAG: hypothetical protein WBC44_14680 [Planctomycetaceae bacterium]